ncbi:MAG: hypothetical protein AAGU74_15295 [Bacillota bacterium]
MSFHIDIEALGHSLEIMGKGMLGIFAVILVIYLCILILNRTTRRKEKED